MKVPGNFIIDSKPCVDMNYASILKVGKLVSKPRINNLQTSNGRQPSGSLNIFGLNTHPHLLLPHPTFIQQHVTCSSHLPP